MAVNITQEIPDTYNISRDVLDHMIVAQARSIAHLMLKSRGVWPAIVCERLRGDQTAKRLDAFILSDDFTPATARAFIVLAEKWFRKHNIPTALTDIVKDLRI